MSLCVEKPEVAGYPTTHWSLIQLATLPEQQAGEGALNRLLVRYYGPLRKHLEHRFQVPRTTAEDWLQGFVAQRILARQVLARADRSRGRFRNFLLRVLDNYVRDELRSRHRQGRQPTGGWVPIDTVEEAVEGGAQRDHSDPFDWEWAMVVLEEAEIETRRYYEGKDRLDTWAVLQDAVLAPFKEGTDRPSGDELARRYGFTSAHQASNAVVTAKRQFGKTLRKVVADYAMETADIDAELRELMAVLSRGR